MEWISVRDRLPDEGENVLCYYVDDRWGWGMRVDHRVKGSIHFFHGISYAQDVTYWMPLPKPPKEVL